MPSRGFNQIEFFPNLIREGLAVGQMKEIARHAAINGAGAITFLSR
jgi:hypothetical protein